MEAYVRDQQTKQYLTRRFGPVSKDRAQELAESIMNESFRMYALIENFAMGDIEPADLLMDFQSLLDVENDKIRRCRRESPEYPEQDEHETHGVPA